MEETGCEVTCGVPPTPARGREGLQVGVDVNVGVAMVVDVDVGVVIGVVWL